jgi:tungstate transport system substrate-binding protein
MTLWIAPWRNFIAVLVPDQNLPAASNRGKNSSTKGLVFCLRGSRIRFCSSFLLFIFIAAGGPFAQGEERLRMATTTSVQDSGLLPDLLPHFEKECGCKVDVIAVGTGQALKIASNGDVDMILVHDPASEKKFVDAGFGIDRKTFMVNDFVIVGPPSDPARIRGKQSASKALSAIEKSGARFISRGDASGTYQKEQSLWAKAGIKPAGSWYMEVGQGMGAVLTIADEKEAYALSDRATYLARVHNLRLQVLVEGDPDLLNYYSAIQVNPARFSSVKSALAKQLVDWLCSPEGQKLIGGYRAGGHQLFKPIYGK